MFLPSAIGGNLDLLVADLGERNENTSKLENTCKNERELHLLEDVCEVLEPEVSILVKEDGRPVEKLTDVLPSTRAQRLKLF